MKARDYFPLGLARDEAFCDRKEETALLLENIKHAKHTLIMAPRRYGKSSLMLHVLKQSGIPYVETDFFLATSEKMIERYILNAVVELIGIALGSGEKIMHSMKNYIKKLTPKLTIGTTGMSLELTVDNDTDPASNIKEALLLLEQLLAEKNQPAVLSFDEFQNVGIIAQGKGVEAAIRHVAQQTKYLTIIFSGSNRKLLQTMFDDESRPLYKLCWRIPLKRIADPYYREHMNKAAQLQWSCDLPEDAFAMIIACSEKHPYYVNKLCDRIWISCDKKPPSVDQVLLEWSNILEEEKSEAINEISQLSLGQKAVLHFIAQNRDALLTSKASIIKLDMPSSSILAAVDALEEKGMIERDDHIVILNPVVKYYVGRF